MPTYPASADLAEGTGTRAFTAVTTTAADYLVVQAIGEDNGSADFTPSAAGLTFTKQRDIGTDSSHTRVQTWTAPDAAGGSRTVTVTPTNGAKRYRARVTVVRASTGPVGTGGTANAQTVSYARQNANSGIFMAVGDWDASAVGTPVWTPGGTTQASQQGSGATYLFGRWDDSGGTATASHGISSPSYGTPTIAVLEMAPSGDPPVPATLTGRPGRVALRSRPGAVLAVAVAALTGRPGRVVLRAQAGTVVAVANATPAGRPARISLHAKAGTVVAVDGPVSVTVQGRPARLDWHARAGTVAATEGATSATLQGQPAHLDLRSRPGAVATEVLVSATMVGLPARLDLRSQPGTVATSAVSLSSREAGIWFRARPGTIEATSPGTSVTLAGRPSKILLIAQPGSIVAISPGVSASIVGRPARLTLHTQPGAVATVASAILPGRPARLDLHARPGDVAAVDIADEVFVGRPARLSFRARAGTVTLAGPLEVAIAEWTPRPEPSATYTARATSRADYTSIEGA